MIQLLAALRIALRALRVNLLRSALTMLGIVIGVAAVITMVAVGSGARQQVQEQIRSLGANLLIILSGSVTSGGARLGLGSRLTISEDDALAIMRDIPGIVAVAPVYRGGAQVVYGNANWSTAILGITPEYMVVREWEVEYGRSFLPEDQAGKAKVALLGVTVAEQLFGDSDPMGQSIRIRNVPFTVIGVLARKGRNTQGQDQDDTILVPLSTAKKRVLGTTAIRSRSVQAIMVKVEEAGQMGEAVDGIRELLRQRHRLQGNDQDDFSIRNLTEIQEAREQSAQILGLLLAAVASVSLVVGGIGIMNIMLVSVTERTREIGLRMAVGGRRRDILIQFLVEAVSLCLLGGLIGIGIGVSASAVIALAADWPVLVSPSVLGGALAAAAVTGIFFGLFPARRAAYLNPIDALRSE
jgi:putative ABC transport system permease protein